MMVPDHRAGTVLRCSNCGIEVQVPAAPGAVDKNAPQPRLASPAIARPEVKPVAPAARQSPQVAGHSTAAKAGIGLPTLSKPSAKSRSKAPAPSAEAKARPKEPAEAAKAVEARPQKEKPVAPPPLPVAPPKPAQPVVAQQVIPAPVTEPPKLPPPLPEPEIVFTSAVVAAPAPIANKPIVDQSTIETVQLPVKKTRPPEPPPVEAPPLAEPIAPLVESPPLAAATPPPLPPTTTEYDPAPPPLTVVQGVRATKAQQHTAWQLAAALLAAALLSIGPSLWEITDYLRSDSGIAVASWAFFLLMLGMVQLATIVLLVQVPDWSSVWIVTLQSLALAAIYAAILGLTVITNGDSSLVSTLQLDQQYSSGKAPPWCICLAATYACIAFFAGRISAKWYKVLRQVQATDPNAAAAH